MPEGLLCSVPASWHIKMHPLVLIGGIEVYSQ